MALVSKNRSQGHCGVPLVIGHQDAQRAATTVAPNGGHNTERLLHTALARATGVHQIYATEKNGIGRSSLAVQPSFYTSDGDAEIGGQFMLATKADARLVQRLDVDMRVLRCRGTQVFHARMVPVKSRQERRNRPLFLCGRLHYHLNQMRNAAS